MPEMQRDNETNSTVQRGEEERAGRGKREREGEEGEGGGERERGRKGETGRQTNREIRRLHLI